MSTGLIVGITVSACITIVVAATIIWGDWDDPEESIPPRQKSEAVFKAGIDPVAPPVPAPVPAPAPVTPQSGVFVNGRQLSMPELQQHQAIYKAPVQPGRYWYDLTSGLYGNWEREAIGYIRTGHAYGRAPANASNGSTGIYLNGRHLNTVELTQWQGLFRQAIQPGHYWLDGNSGNVGLEGNPTPTGNVRAAIQASRGYR